MAPGDILLCSLRFLEDAKAAVPHQLASHEAAKVKPGSIEAKSRRDTVIFSKK